MTMIANEASGENGSSTMRRIIAATVLATTTALTALVATPVANSPALADGAGANTGVGCCRG